MNLVCTKIVVATLFAIIRLFFGILPLKLQKFWGRWETELNVPYFINERRHQQVTCALAMCQSFGGGALFATAFLHMMPEVYRSVEELKKYGNLRTEYPLSQMTISCGFFFVYFVEEFSHWFVHTVPIEPCAQKHNNLGNRQITPLTSKVSPAKEKPKEKQEPIFIIDEKQQQLDEMPENVSVCTEVMNENEKNNEKNLKQLEEEEKEAQEIQDQDEEKASQKSMRFILIVVALSLHSIFDGLSIGLQKSVSNIWYLFTAVSIHSATILFYISLEMLLATYSIKRILYHVTILSITNPVGVLIGLVITLTADMNTRAKSVAVVLLEGLSAGTILYITFFEILSREKQRRVFRLRRALCILSGFGLMAILQCWEIHEE